MSKKNWKILISILFIMALLISNTGGFIGVSPSAEEGSVVNKGNDEEESTETNQESSKDVDNEDTSNVGEVPDTIDENISDQERPNSENEDGASVNLLRLPVSAVDNADEFRNAFSSVVEGATIDIELTRDIILQNAITIDADNVTVNIKGNHSIRVSANSLFRINANNVTFNLEDITIFNGGFRLVNANRSLTVNGNKNVSIVEASSAIDAVSESTNSSVVVNGINFERNTGVIVRVTHSFGGNGNTSEKVGGAIAIATGSLQISNSQFLNNNAQFVGGAIYSDKASISLSENNYFEANEATIGGSVYLNNGNLKITENTIFKNNKATDTRSANSWSTMGAAICINNGNANIDGVSFINNKTIPSTNVDQNNPRQTYGGAIRTHSATLNITNSTFTGSEANWGAAIYAVQGDTYLETCTASGNIANPSNNNSTSSGGGFVMNWNGAITANNCTVNNNSANGIYGNGGVLAGNNVKISISGGTYTSNVAGGKGGVIELEGNGSINISNAGFNSNNAGTQGGVIDSTGAVDVNESSFTINNAQNGGAIYMIGNASLNARGSDFTTNEATTGSGGAIYVNSGPLTVGGGNITTNTANVSGGGIFTARGTTILQDDIIVNGNRANGVGDNAGGGGVYSNSGNITLKSGSLFSNEASASGGAIGNVSGTITMDDGDVYNNTTTGNGGGGMALYTGTFIMNGGTIRENTTTGNGGGILNYYGSVNITTGRILSNEASNGGGIYLQGDTDGKTVLSLKNLEISNNRAVINTNATGTGEEVGRGGGIYANIRSKSSLLEDVSIIENTAESYAAGMLLNFDRNNVDLTNQPWKNITISQNNAPIGGGIYSYGNGKLIFEDSEITLNEAHTYGGGIYNQMDVTFKQSTIAKNKAKTLNGGGIYITGNEAMVTISGGTVASNEAAGYGGGIYIYNNAILHVTDGAVIGGDDLDGNTAHISGGGIYLSTGKLDIDGEDSEAVQIQGNKASSHGGGIYVRNGTLDMRYTEVFNNEAMAGSGGGVYLLLADPGDGSIFRGSLVKNEFLRQANGENIIQAISNNNIHNNKASLSGGGLFIHIKEAGVSNEIIGNQVVGNEATDGGGVYLNYEGTGKSIQNNKVANNHASHNGGGMYITGKGETIASANRMGLTNDQIIDNIADNNGGGIYLDNSDLVLLNAYDKYGLEGLPKEAPTLKNNQASNGGGIYVDGESEFEIWAGTSFIENKASQDGGAIFIFNRSTFTFVEPTKMPITTYSYFLGNSATNGGAIYGIGNATKDDMTTTIYNAIITDNIASEDGGGIWLMSERLKDLKMKNVAFVYDGKQNHAGYYEETPASSDQAYHTNIGLLQGYTDISTPDNNGVDDTKNNSSFTYNNYDIKYRTSAVTVIFNANGGSILLNGVDTAKVAHPKDYLLDSITNTAELEDKPTAIRTDNSATFLGWFLEKPVPNTYNVDYTTNAYISALTDIENYSVTETVQFYAGWLFAPTITPIYETGVYNENYKFLTGVANPNAVVKIVINDQEYIADNNGIWVLDLEANNIILTLDDVIEAYQYYENSNYSDGQGGYITSPKAKAMVLKGYTITYRDLVGGTSVSHTITDNQTDFTKYAETFEFTTYTADQAQFQRQGYSFAGWALEPNSGVVKFDADSEYVIKNLLVDENISEGTEGIVLYAVWRINYYSITYDLGELSDDGALLAPVDNAQYTLASTAQIQSATDVDGAVSVHNGYYFVGWEDQHSGKIYQPGNTHSFTGDGLRDVSLVALWKPTPDISVTKESNITDSVKVGDMITYTITVENTGKGTWHNGEIRDEIPTQLMFTNNSTVQLKLNGQEAPDTIFVDIIVDKTTNTEILKVSGVELEENDIVTIIVNLEVSGSATTSTFSNTAVASGEDSSKNRYEGDDTSSDIYVQGFTLTYHPNFPEADENFNYPKDSGEYIYGEDVTISYVIDERDEYEFLGWSKNPDAIYPEFEEVRDITVVIEEDTILYAVYREIPTLDITLTKVANENNIDKPLQGAEFLLRRLKDGGNPDSAKDWIDVDRYISDLDGKVVFSELKEGIYRGYETTPPKGYTYPVGNSNYITVEVVVDYIDPTTNQKVLKANYPTLAENGGTVESVMTTAENNLIAYNKKLEDTSMDIEFKKKDDLNATVRGAEFTLYSFDENTSDWILVGESHIADNEGLFTWYSIVPGKYQLREVKVPSGYILPSGTYLEFEVGETPEGKLVLIKDNSQEILGIDAFAFMNNKITFDAVNPRAVEVTKEVSQRKVYVGEEIEYTVTVKNPGTFKWYGTFTDALETGLVYDRHTIVQGQNVAVGHDNGVVTIDIVELDADETVEIKLYVKAETTGVYENQIVGTLNQKDDDFNIPVDVTSNETLVENKPTLTKTVDKTNVLVDDLITYTIELKNISESTYSTTLEDTLEAGLQYIKHVVSEEQSSKVVINHHNGKITVEIDELDIDETIKIEIIVQATKSGEFENTVTAVLQDADDTNRKPLELEDDADKVFVDNVPYLEKTVDKVVAEVNEVITYTIKLHNPSRRIWQGTLEDDLEEYLEFVGYNVVSGSATVTEVDGLITISDIQISPNDTIEIKLQVKAIQEGYYKNVITGILEDENSNKKQLEEKESEETVVSDRTQEKSQPPKFNEIYEGDNVVTGKGIPGSKVEITLPNGDTKETTVDDFGNWVIEVPEDVYLNVDEKLIGRQTEPGKEISDKVDEPVKLVTPPTIDEVYEGDTIVTGKGHPDTVIVVTLPDGTEIVTEVDKDGNWKIQVPDTIYLRKGEKILVDQIRNRCLKKTSTIVKGPVSTLEGIKGTKTGDSITWIMTSITMMICAIGVMLLFRKKYMKR